MTHQSAPRGRPTGYINPQTPRLLNTSSLLWLSCFPQWHHQLWIPPLFQSLYLKTPCHFCPLVPISWLTFEAFQNVVPNDHTLLLIIPILGPPLKSGCLSSLTQARSVLRYLFLQLKKKSSPSVQNLTVHQNLIHIISEFLQSQYYHMQCLRVLWFSKVY